MRAERAAALPGDRVRVRRGCADGLGRVVPPGVYKLIDGRPNRAGKVVIRSARGGDDLWVPVKAVRLTGPARLSRLADQAFVPLTTAICLLGVGAAVYQTVTYEPVTSGPRPSSAPSPTYTDPRVGAVQIEGTGGRILAEKVCVGGTLVWRIGSSGTAIPGSPECTR